METLKPIRSQCNILLGRERTERRKAMETWRSCWSLPEFGRRRERTERRKAMETVAWRSNFVRDLCRERTERRKAMETGYSTRPHFQAIRLVGNALNAERQWRPPGPGPTHPHNQASGTH